MPKSSLSIPNPLSTSIGNSYVCQNFQKTVVATWLHKALRWFKREDFLMSWLSISLTAHTVLRQFYCGTFFGLYSPLWILFASRKGMFSFHESRLFFGHLLAAFPSMMLRIPKSSCHFLDQAGTAPPGSKEFQVLWCRIHALRTIYLPVQTRNIKYHQVSSNIIKYHQISSNEDKPPWHHPASCGTSCQRYADSSWEGSLKPTDVDRSVGYVTICRVCSWAQQCRATGKDNPKFNTILPSPRKSASNLLRSTKVWHDVMSPTKGSCLPLQTFALHPRHTTSLTRSWWYLFDSLNTEDTAALPEYNQYTQYISVSNS